MAHELEIINGQAKMAYFGKTPWHGLSTKLAEEDLYSWERVLEKSGLNWDVELTPLFTGEGKKVDHRGVRRVTDGAILGVVGPRFVPLQNKAAFSWFTPYLEAKEVQLHTAGSLRGGSRVWVLAKINRPNMKIAEGDEVEKYLLLSHAHDGSLAVRVGLTGVRVCCSNTIALAHRDKASQLIRLRHSSSLKTNLENIREAINLANEAFEANAELYRKLAHKHINQDDIVKYVKKVLEIPEEASTRSNNIVESVVNLVYTGRGNDLPAIRGTAWAAYNGVTEYLAYQRGHSQDNRLNSLFWGEGATINQNALVAALDMAS